MSDEWGGPHVHDKDSTFPDARGGSYQGRVQLAELQGVCYDWVGNIDITCCCKFWHFRHCCEQNWIHERQPVLWLPLLWSQSSVEHEVPKVIFTLKLLDIFQKKKIISFKFRSNLVLEWFAEGVVEGKYSSVWNQNNSKGKIASQWQTCESNWNNFGY